MKVLVLSCQTGNGHYSAAHAICEQFKNLNIECDFLDFLKFNGNNVHNIVTNTLNNMHPNIFRTIYKAGELVEKLPMKSPVYYANSFSKDALEKHIIENNYDVIVSTHVFASEALTAIKKKRNIFFVSIATDYTAIPFWNEVDSDYLIIAHEDLKPEFIKKGIPENTIIPLGIPVSLKFNQKISKFQARQELNLDNKKTILIMTGATGFGNPALIVDELLKEYQTSINIIVITGHNQNLRNKLLTKYSNQNIKILGFVNNINLYMDASNILLTKPGGLSSTEGAIKNIPIIFTPPIPGCETCNATFFEKNGIALIGYNKNNMLNHVDTLFNDKLKVEQMIKNQDKFINKHAALDICNFIIENKK